MKEETAICSVASDSKTEIQAAELCAALTRGFLAAGGNPASRIVLEVRSPTRVDATVTDGQGRPHGPISFDVVDTELRADMLEGFGADIARVVARANAADG